MTADEIIVQLRIIQQELESGRLSRHRLIQLRRAVRAAAAARIASIEEELLITTTQQKDYVID